MLFNSLDFLLFFAVVLLLYYLVPKKIQWLFVLAASLVFYASHGFELLLLLLGFTAVNYIGSVLIDTGKSKRAKKTVLVLAILFDFALLAVFKYLVFMSDSLKWVYGQLGLSYNIKPFGIALPAGISFYTFIAVGYLVDVYRGDYRAEKDPLKFATFISFFPQITAGPIERGSLMLPQLFTPKRLRADNISSGLKIMLWGYFKKVVIADRLNVLVSTVFGKPREFEGFALLIAALAFTVQIYCDFSGYSDIARGCAKTMGIDLINNFDKPYFATSIRDFWRRWHISLSTWFRDYVYIPLGGNRVSMMRQWLNFMVTFTASGLWHGANWSFAVWGALHGIYQIIGNIKYRITGKREHKLWIVNIFAAVFTFILVAFAWIFFKASNVSDGFYIAANLFKNITAVRDKQYLYEVLNSLGLNLFELILSCGAVAFLFLCELFTGKGEVTERVNKLPFVLRFVFYYIIAMIILLMGVFSGGGDFIYFEF